MGIKKISPKSWHFKVFKHRFDRKWRIGPSKNRCEYAAEVLKELFWFFFTGCWYTLAGGFVTAAVGMFIYMIYQEFVFCFMGSLTMTWFIALSIGLSIFAVFGTRKLDKKYSKTLFELEETKFYTLLYDYVIAKKNKACPPVELPKEALKN